MPSALQDLRKAAGFDTAKAFAAEMGIPETTYARYERDPGGIPLEPAWKLADRLGCTIDAVVGRAEPDPMADRGEVQRRYDALSGQSRALFDDFLEFVETKSERERAARDLQEAARYLQLARTYEKLFMESIERDDDLFLDYLWGTEESQRAAFEGFVERRMAELREREVDAICTAKENELELCGGAIFTLDENGASDPIWCDDPRFYKEIEKLIEGMRKEELAERERRDKVELPKVMAAYDELHAKTPVVEFDSAVRPA